MWARFSRDEMARRWALARGLMQAHGLDGLHLDLHHNYLVAPQHASIEPALYVGLKNHVPAAREIADVPVWDESRPAPEGRRFEERMAVVIQPNPITPDEQMGLQLGAEFLHGVPFDPVVVRA